jgi:hypothetical protein
MSDAAHWRSRLPDGFVLMIVAMIALVVITWSAMGIMADNDAAAAEGEYQFKAVAAGQAVIREAQSKAFDQRTIADAASVPEELTDPAHLGSDPGESASTAGAPDTEVPGAGFNSTVMFNDVDDYNGYRRIVHSGGTRDLLVDVAVWYASPTAPDSVLSFPSTCKRMSVRVSPCDRNGSVIPDARLPVVLHYAFFSPPSDADIRN